MKQPHSTASIRTVSGYYSRILVILLDVNKYTFNFRIVL